MRRLSPAEAGFAVALLAVTVALLLTAPTQGWGPAFTVVCVSLVLCLAAGVQFQVGAGWCTPMQVAQVPLWLLVPPAFLVPLLAGALVVGAVIADRLAGRRRSAGQLMWAAADAWHAVGAAAALAVLGVPDATWASWDVLLAVFVAQAVADAVYAVTHGRWVLHLGLRDALRSTAWIAAVDGALLPIGFLVAYALTVEPWIALAMVPVVCVFAEFSRERDARLRQTIELSTAYRGTAALMAQVLERDHAYTGGEHAHGVVDLALAVGDRLGLTGVQWRDLEFGALLHDIGKLKVPNELLNKPGALSDEEWAIVRRHPEFGQRMLDRVGGALSAAGRVVRSHHEAFDGSGYPDGLAGEAIPLPARIIAVCDAYSAMTTDRAYRAAMTPAAAVAELERCRGSQFDPQVVHALVWVLVERGAIATRPVRSPLAAAAAAGHGPAFA